MIRPAAELAQALEYEFSDPQLLETALTHRSVGARNGERLEFLGDAFLGFYVARLLYQQCSDASEGKMSRMRASLVRKETLAEIARHWQLGEYIRLGPGELRSGGFRRDSILSDAVEALIGAVLIDSGVEPAETLIRQLFGNRLQHLTDLSSGKDPKSRLQEALQALSVALPEYSIAKEEGPAHKPSFVVQVTIPTLSIQCHGEGGSRRAAEQAAAEAALQEINDAGQ